MLILVISIKIELVSIKVVLNRLLIIVFGFFLFLY